MDRLTFLNLVKKISKHKYMYVNLANLYPKLKRDFQYCLYDKNPMLEYSIPSFIWMIKLYLFFSV